MPWDAPGSLSITTYQQVLAFLLLQDGFVQSSDVFDVTTLNNIMLR
jgi:hypothetical protein